MIMDGIMSMPNHWKIDRIKNVGSVNARVGWKALKASEYVEKGYFFLSTPNIKDTDIDYENVNYITSERYFESPEIMLQRGDVLLVKDGSTLGIVNIIKDLPAQGTVNSSIAVLRFKNLNPLFAYYFLKSNGIQQIIQLKKDGMGVPHLFQKDINNFEIVIPPKKEQTAIASFLDQKTTVIDRKIEILQQKIHTYTELRKSIISDAVTQGIDKKADMVISDLLIRVPAKWKKTRLKNIGRLFSGLSGKSGDDFNQEDNPDNKGFIPFTNIANNIYLDPVHLGTVVVNPVETQNEVQKGDIFFLMSSEGYEDIGKTAVLKHDLTETYLNSFCKGFRINLQKNSPYFLNYLLLSDFYRKRMMIEGKGFTRINLKMEKVNDFQIYLPANLDEQNEIAEYLDRKTSVIGSILANIQNQITTLQELRKSLINDAVTGKIKVS